MGAKRVKRPTKKWESSAALVIGLQGCFFLNTFNDVVPSKATVSSTASLQVSSSNVGGMGGLGGAGGAGGESEPVPDGVIAIAGQFLGQEVLYALDHTTGSTLTQEFAIVAALGHDGKRDEFYVFEATSLPVKPGDRGKMTVRSMDLKTKEWTIVSTIENILMPRSVRDLIVMRNRLAYLVDGANGAEIALLNTNSTETVQVIMPETTPLTPLGANSTYLDVVATRHPLGAAGGLISLVSVASSNGECTLQLRRVEIKEEQVIEAPMTQQIGGTFPCASTPAVARDERADAQVFALPPAAGQQQGTLIRFDADAQIVLDQFPFAVTKSPTRLQLALAHCEQIAFIAIEADQTVMAMPLGPGTSNSTLVLHPFDFAVEEASEQRVLIGYSQGENFAVSALDLSGSCTDPKITLLTEGTGFLAPLFLAPRIVATARENPPLCPVDCVLE